MNVKVIIEFEIEVDEDDGYAVEELCSREKEIILDHLDELYPETIDGIDCKVLPLS